MAVLEPGVNLYHYGFIAGVIVFILVGIASTVNGFLGLSRDDEYSYDEKNQRRKAS